MVKGDATSSSIGLTRQPLGQGASWEILIWHDHVLKKTKHRSSD